MSRELARRLVALEQRQGADRRHHIVSDQPLPAEQWAATKGGDDIGIDEPSELSPILTEAEWLAQYCQL